jgi:gliding motility-associated lipoprotein GldD
MKYCFYLFLLTFAIASCAGSSDYSPKPRGYFRIEYPKKNYLSFNQNPHYSFDYPIYAKMLVDSSEMQQANWYNLSFPQFNAKLHISYYNFRTEEEFNKLVEDARKLAFKHTVKATGIDEGRINIPEKKVYGIYYSISGNTASSTQFILTDSTKNFLRGALYFNEKPQEDSIQPIIDFIKVDIDRMIKTFKWQSIKDN